MASSTAAVTTIESEAVTSSSLANRPQKAIYLSSSRADLNDIDIELNERCGPDHILQAGEGIPCNEVVHTEQIETVWNPYMNRYRVLACCLNAFGLGLNDSAPGALIASIERCVYVLLTYVAREADKSQVITI